jgi:hypothetical protein
MTGTRADTSIFGNLFEFCRSPSIHSDHDRYPMMDEIIGKVPRRLKTRLGKCEADRRSSADREPLQVMKKPHGGDPVFSDGGGRVCSVGWPQRFRSIQLASLRDGQLKAEIAYGNPRRPEGPKLSMMH